MIDQPQDLESRFVQHRDSAHSHTKAELGAPRFTLPISWLIFFAVYTLSLLFGTLTVSAFSTDTHESILVATFIADLVGACIVFVASIIFQHSLMVIPYNNIANIAIAWYWYNRFGHQEKAHTVLAAIAITLHGLTGLGWYLRRWPGIAPRDASFSILRSIYHFVNTMINFAGLILAYHIFESKDYAHLWLLITGFVVCCVGNYAGNMVFWFGLWLMTISIGLDLWWTIFVPLLVIVADMVVGFLYVGTMSMFFLFGIDSRLTPVYKV